MMQMKYHSLLIHILFFVEVKPHLGIRFFVRTKSHDERIQEDSKPLKSK